ncbi:MAG: PDC sensor domain-containing protein [Leptospiraceae bacterium]|nr:PDC sensor domain-containing protein [Leptospiraceae bacterium]
MRRFRSYIRVKPGKTFQLVALAFLGLMLVLMLLFTYNLWLAVKREQFQRLRYLNTILSASTRHGLENYESYLSMIGHRLLARGALQQPERGRPLIESLKKEDMRIVAYGLAAPSGQLKLVSGIPSQNLPDLSKMEQTRDSFAAVLHTRHVQLGRSYYFTRLGSWVIPARVALLDLQGEVTGVMTAGIKIDGGHLIWGELNLPADLGLEIVRDDGYRQYRFPIKDHNYKKYYDDPVNASYKQLIQRLHTENTNIIVDQELILAHSYLAEFGLHIVTSMPYSGVLRIWIKRLIPAGLAFFFGILLFLGTVLYASAAQDRLLQLLERRNQRLKSSNDILKDYCFHNSHTVRRYAANIVGLARLLNQTDGLNAGERLQLQQKLLECGEELDQTIQLENAKLEQSGKTQS